MKILLLLNGTKWSYKAAMHTKMLALKEAAAGIKTEVTLFSVVDIGEIRAAAYFSCVESNSCRIVADREDELMDALVKKVTANAEDISKTFKDAGISCTFKIVNGQRKYEILKEANTFGYDLLVMGDVGKKVYRPDDSFHADLGSGTEIPILIVK